MSLSDVCAEAPDPSWRLGVPLSGAHDPVPAPLMLQEAERTGPRAVAGPHDAPRRGVDESRDRICCLRIRMLASQQGSDVGVDEVAVNHPVVWMADWSDAEDAEFRAACDTAGLAVRVVRSAPLGKSVGRPIHRFRSYPRYVSLALRGRVLAEGGSLVAWQPLAGVVAGLLPRARSERLIVLNPNLRQHRGGIKQTVKLAGAARADRVVFYSRAALEGAAALGLPRDRLSVVPLGVRPRRSHPTPPGSHLLAVGRDHRDWRTLAAAARDSDLDVVVTGPSKLPPDVDLPLVRTSSPQEYHDLVESSAAVVVPLLDGDRAAGLLAFLDAFSLGRPVVATDGSGTRDYITPDRGILVPAGDPAALRSAMESLTDSAVSSRMGAEALAATRGELSLQRFVEEIYALACEIRG